MAHIIESLSLTQHLACSKKCLLVEFLCFKSKKDSSLSGVLGF